VFRSATEIAPSVAESMYYSMQGHHRPARVYTEHEAELVQEGMEGMNKLWQSYLNESDWKVEKVVVSFESGTIAGNNELQFNRGMNHLGC